MAVMGNLTVREHMVLDFEGRGWWRYQGAKVTTVRKELGYSDTTYYQVLNDLIDRPEAMAYAPLTVKRLRRLREQRRAQRSRVDVSYS
jgi:hypothetical protein